MSLDLTPQAGLDELAQDYVRLALHLHNHDPNPNIYIGAKDLQASVKKDKRALSDLDIVQKNWLFASPA